MAALTDPKSIKDLPTATEMPNAVADVFAYFLSSNKK